MRSFAQNLRSTALLLSFVLLASQTLSQQHVHVDEEAFGSCVVCSHADNSADAAQPAAGLVHALPAARYVTQRTTNARSGQTALPLARAPPQA